MQESLSKSDMIVTLSINSERLLANNKTDFLANSKTDLLGKCTYSFEYVFVVPIGRFEYIYLHKADVSAI